MVQKCIHVFFHGFQINFILNAFGVIFYLRLVNFEYNIVKLSFGQWLSIRHIVLFMATFCYLYGLFIFLVYSFPSFFLFFMIIHCSISDSFTFSWIYILIFLVMTFISTVCPILSWTDRLNIVLIISAFIHCFYMWLWLDLWCIIWFDCLSIMMLDFLKFRWVLRKIINQLAFELVSLKSYLRSLRSA